MEIKNIEPVEYNRKFEPLPIYFLEKCLPESSCGSCIAAKSNIFF